MAIKMNRTVITGVGLVTALGRDVRSTWENLLLGRSGVKPITLFDAAALETRIAAEVGPEIEQETEKLIGRRDRKQMTRATQTALVAANEAIRDSGIDFKDFDPVRIAVILGVITPSYNEMEQRKSDAYIIVKAMPDSLSAWLSLHYGLEGPNFSLATACASSAYAIGLGHQMIQAGMADVVITGGSDSHIDPMHIKGFNQLLALSVRNEEPETACRPFSRSRDGFVIGEGAGILVLESENGARRRGANIYGEVAGYALTSEANDMTAPRANGAGMAKTMRLALDAAGINAEAVDYINAHGTSTYLNDRYETMAIKACFGAHASQLAISSSKSMLGHTIGAAGAIEGIISVLSIKHGLLTPTINYIDPDPELDLDYLPNQSREQKIATALSNSFGFGGHNASVIYRGV